MTDDDGLLWWFIIPVAVMTLVRTQATYKVIGLHCCFSTGFLCIPTNGIVQVLLLSDYK